MGKRGERSIKRRSMRNVDNFKIGSVVKKIMALMEMEGVTDGEAEEIPRYLERAIIKNGEQHRKGAPFTVFKN